LTFGFTLAGSEREEDDSTKDRRDQKFQKKNIDHESIESVI
jgi:hypothetical protein